MMNFATVPADLMSAFQLIPYQSAEDTGPICCGLVSMSHWNNVYMDMRGKKLFLREQD